MRLITSAFPGLRRLDENGTDIGPDLVRRCVASWQANGFSVLSVHHEAERELIDAPLPGVDYRFIDEPIPQGARRLPSLAAVLGDLPADEPVGIVNADIFMVPLPDMAARMAARARSATLVMHRWDVPSLDRREGRRFDLGVDLIAFTPSAIAPAIEGLVRRPYRLGVPWWDYALPLAASLYAPLVHVSDTLVLHQMHEQAWNEEEWRAFAAISTDYLREQAALEGVDARLGAAITMRLDEIDEFFAGAPGATVERDRVHAISDLMLHFISRISDAHAVSLLADLSAPPPDKDSPPPWQPGSPLTELRAAVLRQRREALLPASGREADAETAPEIATPLERRLETRITTTSSSTAIIRAGMGDMAAISALTTRLVARRFRRWRRGMR